MPLLFGQQNNITYVTVLGRETVGQKLQMTDDGIASILTSLNHHKFYGGRGGIS
jgi:hypothetical protein